MPAQLALVNGELPRPLNKIAETILKNSGKPFEVTVASTDVMGRSLQAPASTYAFPRQLFLVKHSTGNRATGFLFAYAYTPLDGKIEVITWNRHTRKHQFIEVTKYGPKTLAAAIDKNVDSICTTCHQAGAPILTRFPWLELASQNSKLRERIERARGALTDADAAELLKFAGFAGENELTSRNLVSVLRASNSVQPLSGFALDEVVRHANKNQQAARVCQAVCAPGDAGQTCRRHTFLISVFGLESLSNREKLEAYKKLYADIVAPRWPKDQFAYASSVLPDRNPESMFHSNGVVALPVIKNAKAVASSEFVREFCATNGSGISDSSKIRQLLSSFGFSDPSVRPTSCSNSSEGKISFSGQKQERQGPETSWSKDFPIESSPLFKDRLSKIGNVLYREEDTTSPLSSSFLSDSNNEPVVSDLNVPYSVSLLADGQSVNHPGHPAMPRPLVRGFTHQEAAVRLAEAGPFGCFGIDRDEVTGNVIVSDVNQRRAFVQKLIQGKALDTLLSQTWPPSREAVLKLLIDASAAGDRPALSNEEAAAILRNYPSVKGPAIKNAAPNSVAATEAHDLKAIVQTRCVQCHDAAASARPLPINGLTSEQIATDLASFRSSRGFSAVDHLRGERALQMPPNNVTGLTSSERGFLIRTFER